MADNRTDIPNGGRRRKLTKRERVILFITVLVLAGALLYQLPYLFFVQYVNNQKTKVDAMDKEVLAIAVQIADMKAREAEIKAGMKNGIVGWDLIDQKGVVLVLEGISAEARKDGVNLLAVHPSREVDKEKYKEVSMNLDLKGRYRDLAEYFKHLENLSQIVNIRKIRVEACPDASSACATQLEAVTYMAK
jgi:Tfp pilus assembly protein PilO